MIENKYVRRLNELNIEYDSKLKELNNISRSIGNMLRLIYTREYLKEFKDLDEFLDELNSVFEHDGTAKLIFVNEVTELYNKNGKTFQF